MSVLTIVIPAKNEARLIERALTAIDRQEMVVDGSFETIVFANDCTDDTAECARAFARDHPAARISVIEGRLPAREAHIGRARRTVMDAAAERFALRGVDGIIASTDADTVVDRRWVATTIRAMRDVDAVAGRITLLPDDEAAMSIALRSAYERDGEYYRTVARLEATLDPLWWDPAPRHADHFGGSFAVRTTTYSRVGGVPVVACLEDVALYEALLRADARVRHAGEVRVQTSGRTNARVTGGYATHLADLETLRDWHVPDPRKTIALVRARAELRRCWTLGEEARASHLLGTLLGLCASDIQSGLDRSLPFGENWHRLATRAAEHGTAYSAVPAAEALAALRAEIDAENAVEATRKSEASGAG